MYFVLREAGSHIQARSRMMPGYLGVESLQPIDGYDYLAKYEYECEQWHAWHSRNY